MTTQPGPTLHTQDAATDALPPPWQRLLALSGVAFAALFVIGCRELASRRRNPRRRVGRLSVTASIPPSCDFVLCV